MNTGIIITMANKSRYLIREVKTHPQEYLDSANKPEFWARLTSDTPYFRGESGANDNYDRLKKILHALKEEWGELDLGVREFEN